MRALALCVLAAGCTPLLPADQLCPPGSPGPQAGLSQPQTIGEGENHPVATTVPSSEV